MKGKYPNYLGDCIKLAGSSQAKLARDADTAPQNVSRFANGSQELTKIWAEMFAPHLPGIEAADLLFGPNRKIPDAAAGRLIRALSEGAVPHAEAPAAPLPGIGSTALDAQILLEIVQKTVEVAITVLQREDLTQTARAQLVGLALKVQLDRLTQSPPVDSSRHPRAPTSPQVRASLQEASRGKPQTS